MNPAPSSPNIIAVLAQQPDAVARVRGSSEYPGISGTVSFYQTPSGVLISAELFGLPHSTQPCSSRVFGFHIHSGSHCSGNTTDPFSDTLTHYNPGNCPHPFHAGDLPPLFENNGHAVLVVLTNRFSVREIPGKTVVIHSDPDDFVSQPAGNAGKKIACGQIASLPKK